MLVVRCCIAALVLLAVFLIIVDAGYFRRGRHRGEYVEKPSWLPPEIRFWDINFNEIPYDPAKVYISGHFLIRDYCPEGDNGRAGRFGDLDIDRTLETPLCINAKTWLPGDS